jgi:hypothetical protein
MGKTRYSFDNGREWSIKLEGSYNFKHKDSYIRPAIAWKNGNVEIESGVDLFYGTSYSFFGGYGNNDRVYLNLAYTY